MAQGASTSATNNAEGPSSLFDANVSNGLTYNGLSGNSSTTGETLQGTYLMPTTPAKARRASTEGYRPKIAKTTGQRPACLVNASVTFCGNDQIYAFGGFDQFTDEGTFV